MTCVYIYLGVIFFLVEGTKKVYTMESCVLTASPLNIDKTDLAPG